MAVDRLVQIGLAGHVAVVDPADAAEDRVQRPERMLQERLAGGGQDQPVDAAVEPVERSEEHTSELQSLMRISYAVFCLKNKKNYHTQSLIHLQLLPLTT